MGTGLRSAVSKRRLDCQVACARLVGRSHAASNTPCQDFAAGRRKPQMAAVALADGAGSRVKSHIGAEAAVRASLRLLLTQFDSLFENSKRDAAQTCILIHQYLMQDLEAAARQHNCNVADLASTLLFVAYKDRRYLACHLGDGVIAQATPNGQLSVLSKPENGEFANTTWFITDQGAPNKMRLYFGEGDDLPSGFVLMSDGTAESLYERRSGTPAAVIGKLLEWNASLSRAKMFDVLDANMKKAFSLKTTDDCSVALLSVAHPHASTLSVPVGG